MKPNRNTRALLKHLACAAALGVGLSSGGASAQTILEVGGAGTIDDQTLTSGSVPVGGVNWTAEGDAGFVYTGLVSPTATVTTTGAVTLTFDHRYFIEAAWDGAAVFVSINGGEFTYVETTAFTANGYDGDTTANAPNSAWGDGENVFYGKSADYDTSALIQSVADLGVLNAGDTVAVEFRGGWDGAYNEPGTDWEIATVKLTDAGPTDILDADFTADGPSGFTVANIGSVSNPWTYPLPTNRFEIDADLLTADRYAPVTAGSVIDLNGANIEVALLAGTLDVGDAFQLFDLSGGTTLTGTANFVGLPPGTWDTSTFNTTGTITCLDAASPLIYEPFADLDPSLNGNTPGLGLTGTWSGQALIADSSLKYGSLKYEGGRAVTNPGNNFDSCGVSPGTTLTDAGLLDDGATLWFSVLIVKHADTSASTDDRRTYFSLGTGTPDGFDRIGGNNGSGYCVAVNKNTNAVQARGWNDDSDGAGGAFGGALDTSVPEGDTFLAVGKITWGEFNVTDDVFELYLPDKDLNLGSPVSTLNANFDQDGTDNAANAFNTIGFAGGRPDNNVPEIDEIRFAANSADVLPLDFAPPELVTTDNASGNPTVRIATFDEEMYIRTGDIRIVNESTPGTTTIPVGDPQVVISGNTLTITPTTPLTGGDTYHIEIDAGAVTDRNLNAFAGISDPDEWEFIVDGTPPTVASFGDNTSPKPMLVNSSGRLVYTVTFSEPMDVGTVEIADFAATAGSAPITVDSVTATGPAVFEVAVSTLGTTGTLALEIVASAVIADVNGLELDTNTAIPSDNTINVTNPTPNAGSIANDFQGTISSQQNALNVGGNGRYFHVSVNPDNAGTGWWCADLPGTGDPAPSGFRNFGGDVVAYKFLGNGGNGDVTSTAATGGEDARITFTTTDPAFDGFDQQTMRLWTTNDPGADLATGAGPSATGWTNPSYGYRGISQIDGFVDISGLASGSVHIYYGAYNNAPSIKVILHDSDNVGEDIVIADVHSVADGGNGDSANQGEQYLAEIDFVTDGIYDVLEYEFTSSNGNGQGVVLTGPEPLDDYTVWAEQFAPADVSDPDADLDGDGLTNGEERLFGLNPTDPASVNPITVPLDAAAGTLSFTRRDDALTGKFTDIETSTDLQNWTVDSGAMLVAGAPDANGVETVSVTLSDALLTAPMLFVRVSLNDGLLLSENFELDNGGFTFVTTEGSDWQFGAPTSSSLGGEVIEGNGGSTNCWGTNIGTPGEYVNPTTTKLRSPVIDLTGIAGAQLTFAEAYDLSETTDTAVVNIIEEASDAIVAGGAALYTATDADDSTADWAPANGGTAIDLTPFVGQKVRIEWSLTGGADQYLGWYIDDVNVSKSMP